MQKRSKIIIKALEHDAYTVGPIQYTICSYTRTYLSRVVEMQTERELAEPGFIGRGKEVSISVRHFRYHLTMCLIFII